MGIRQFRLAKAKKLRANLTDSERRMWRALKQIPIEGTHFRRQVAIGPYIVDFACMRKKLIVEIDGGQHSFDKNAQNDAVRTSWLEQDGYRVVRYWNTEVMNNIDGVLQSLNAQLQAQPSAHPSPARSARRPSPSRGG